MDIPSITIGQGSQYRRRSCVPAFQEITSYDLPEQRPRSRSFSNAEQSPLFPSRCKERCPTPFCITPKVKFHSFNFETPIDIISSRSPSVLGLCRRNSKKWKAAFNIRRIVVAVLALFSLTAVLIALYHALCAYFEKDISELIKEGHFSIYQQSESEYEYDEKKYMELLARSGKLMKFKPPEPPTFPDNVMESFQEEATTKAPYVPKTIPIFIGKNFDTIDRPKEEPTEESFSTTNKPVQMGLSTYPTPNHEFSTLAPPASQERMPELGDRRRIETKSGQPNMGRERWFHYDQDRMDSPQLRKPSMMKILSNQNADLPHRGGKANFQDKRVPPGINPHVYYNYRRDEF